MAKVYKYDKEGIESVTDTSKEKNPSREIPTIYEINRTGEEVSLFNTELTDQQKDMVKDCKELLNKYGM